MANALDITDRESLGRWLEDKPAEWAQLIALRAALRVFPLVLQGRDAEKADSWATRQLLSLAAWRCLFIASIIRKDADRELEALAVSAAKAAFAATDTHTSSSIADATVTAAAYAIVATYDASIYDAATAAAYAAIASDRIDSHVDESVVWEAVRCECAILLERDGLERLETCRLWLELEENANNQFEPVLSSPVWVEKAMPGFSKALVDLLGPDAELIVEWYQPLFSGYADAAWSRMFLGDRARDLALKDNAFWKVTEERPGEQVMEDIARVLGWERPQSSVLMASGDVGTIAEIILGLLNTKTQATQSSDVVVHVQSLRPEIERKSVYDNLSRLASAGRIEKVGNALYRGIPAEAQPVAPFNFALVEDRIDVTLPAPQLTVSEEYRDDQWAALMDALANVAACVSRQTNAYIPQSMLEQLGLLTASLGQTPESVRPGVLQSHWRKMARAMATLSREKGTGSSDVDDALDGVADALEDLRGCYADIRNQEKEMIRLGITARTVDIILPFIEDIAEYVKQAGGELVTQAAQDAVKYNIELIKSETDKSVAADLVADQVLTDQALGTLLANALRVKSIPKDIRDAVIKDIASNRDMLVKGLAKLPARAVKGAFLILTLDYIGALDGMVEYVPALKPLLKRLKRLTGQDDSKPLEEDSAQDGPDE